MRRSISRIIRDRAEADPDEVVVVDELGEMSSRELVRAAVRLAHRLRDAGVELDDLVAVSLPNSRDVVIATCAVWMAGATPLPMSASLGVRERGAIEQTGRPAAAIGARPVDGAIPWIPDVRSDDGRADGVPLPDLAASSWKAPTTSGSTGAPKIVKATSPALLDPERPVAPFLPRRAVQLIAGPLTHSATFTYAFRGLLTGHRLVILPRFDEREWVSAVEAHGVTWALVVPTMMHRLLRLPNEEREPDRMRSLETVLHMGAPCAPDLKAGFLDWVGASRVVEVYAGSESNGLTMIRGDEWRDHPGSVGRPISGTQIEVRAADGSPVPNGEVGVVWMRRGDQPTYEYIGGASRRQQDGWDTLGDLGRVDDDGYLHLVDREDDVINRGGDKIYPVVVEQALERHPRVRSAVAYGVADAEWGQAIHAVADVAEDTVSDSELRTWAHRELGRLAPAQIRIVHDPVRNDAGKTSRRAWGSR